MKTTLFKLFMKTFASLILLMMSSVSAGAIDITDPKTVIEKTVTSIILVLEEREDKGSLSETNRQSIRDAVKDVFDYRIMSKYSLGKAWKKLDESTRTTFTNVFKSLMERSYGNRLSTYNGQKLIFNDATFKKGKARVKSLVIDSHKTTPIEYRLHQSSGGHWMVYDIRIEGVSLIRTFRDDFKSTLKKVGFEGLLNALKERVARLEAKDKA